MLGSINNPGNIVDGPFARRLGATGAHGRFAIFPSMQAGICALAENLLNYQAQHGIDTARGTINRWAPSNENDTNGYLAFFDTVLGCKPDDHFDFSNRDFLYWAVVAIGEEENGKDAFLHAVSDADIDAGIDAALAA